MTLYCYYFFYESKISTIYTFYKEKNGKYFQGSGGSSDFKTFTTEPYSAPYHKIVLDEESESYVLENCGNFGIELDPLEDPNLDNTGYFVEVNFDNGPNELFVF
ncbi:MAG: hypothetical protein LBB45_08595 [Methanobrevibacter sp.]|nr:hypothetical protein [Candidatus Methanovirga basalitermitum]